MCIRDRSTGSVNFAASSTAQSAANITLSDATGTTNIFPAYIETGNLRIAGNSLTSTTGQVIVTLLVRKTLLLTLKQSLRMQYILMSISQYHLVAQLKVH